MVLITGASGTVGRAVLDAVSHGGEASKAMYRSAADAASAPPGVTTVIADFADKQSLRAALQGVEKMFLVCSPIPQLVELESNVIDVAKECGVKFMLLNSALGAGDYPKSFPAWHAAVEEKLKASGLAFTSIRPNSFLQNILAYMAPSIRAQGAFYSAAGEAKYSYLDVRDIAAACAAILREPAKHNGRFYELNGPEAVTNADLARRISRVAGRQVSFVNIPEDAQRKAMLGSGMPEWQVTALLDLQRYYIGGKGGEVDGLLRELIGRDPVTLDKFLEEFKASFEPQAASGL